MTENLLSVIQEKIFALFENLDGAPEYLDLLHQSVGPRTESDQSSNPIRWALLPGLCCQAAGGDPMWSANLSAAWFLFYAAAHLMDKVQDKDEPDPWWADTGPEVALSVVTGLFFSASQSLNQLYIQPDTRQVASEICEDFFTHMKTMSAGQYQDLINPQPSLDDYWHIVESKSAAFFSLACRSGAFLASQDKHQLDCYSRFGFHLGIILQILDDLDDLQPNKKSLSGNKWASFRRSLPVIYALTVLPEAQSKQLDRYFQTEPDSTAISAILDIIENSGAALYLLSEIEGHKNLALQALEEAKPQEPANKELRSILLKLVSSST